MNVPCVCVWGDGGGRFFPPLDAVVGEGDWLESHPTKGQSVAAFLHRKGRKEVRGENLHHHRTQNTHTHTHTHTYAATEHWA